jgi:1-acyl-sn-glycerol-3-phosphate acyltransferase
VRIGCARDERGGQSPRPRERVSRPLYATVRALLIPFMRLYFRMHIAGAAHIPAEGPPIVAPNHKSFYDSSFIAACTRRPLRFMARSELIAAPYGRLLVGLGAFPVRAASRTRRRSKPPARSCARAGRWRSSRTARACATRRASAFKARCRAHCARHGCAARAVRDHWDRSSPRGSVPEVAPGPSRLRGADLRSGACSHPEVASELVEGTLWPEVEGEYRRLRARPTLIAPGLAALGIGGRLLLRSRRRR